MEIGEKIAQILQKGLDNENCISVDDAMQLLNQAEYDLEGIGVTGNEGETLQDILGDLNEYFEILDKEDNVFIKCKTSPSPSELLPQSDQQPQFNAGETTTLYRRISDVIKSLLRKNSYPDRCVPLSDVGQELRNLGHTLPEGEKISSFLRKEPSQFEIINNETDSYVRLVNGAIKKQPAAPAVVPASGKVQNHMISMYNIFDFAYFADYNDAKGNLAQLATQDDWFIIPDEAIKDKYALLDYKLRTRFAMLVRAQLQGESDGIKVGLDEASFDTGFVSLAGQPIIAYFILNLQRNNARWQTYEFKEFREA